MIVSVDIKYNLADLNTECINHMTSLQLTSIQIYTHDCHKSDLKSLVIITNQYNFCENFVTYNLLLMSDDHKAIVVGWCLVVCDVLLRQ